MGKHVLKSTRRRRGVTEAWVEAPLDKSWMVAYRIVRDASGEPVVGEVRVFPFERSRGRPPSVWSAAVLGATAKVPVGGLPAQILRKVRLGDYRRFESQSWQRSLQSLTATYSRPPQKTTIKLKVRKDVARRFSEAIVTPKLGRPRKPDEFYAEIAKEYVGALRKSSSPVADIAKHHGLSQGRVRDIIHEARERGLLTRTRRGRSGGQLTDLAKEVLAAAK